MKRIMFLVAVVGLTACSRPGEGYPAARNHGRFEGVGIYPAGLLWSRLATTGDQGAPAAAKLRDDDQVIVVVDSNTGEIRECGNLSGYCVGMNPWAHPISAPQTAPVSVQLHVEEAQRKAVVEAEAEAAAASDARTASSDEAKAKPKH